MFLIHLYDRGFRHSTLRAMLGALSFFHKKHSLPDPTKTFRLNRILKGISKTQKGKNKLRPIRKYLLLRMVAMLNTYPSNYTRKLLKAVLLITYHGCFRIGEVVKSTNPQHAMRIENLSFLYKDDKLAYAKFKLHTFKHAKHPIAVKIPVEYSQNCPVAALLDFLHLRGHHGGLLFVQENGKPVTRDFVAAKIKDLISALGKDASHFNTHSLRIGRTTDMSLIGVPEHIIKQTGRWRSDAYDCYVRIESFEVPRVHGYLGA